MWARQLSVPHLKVTRAQIIQNGMLSYATLCYGTSNYASCQLPRRMLPKRVQGIDWKLDQRCKQTLLLLEVYMPTRWPH